MNYHHFPLEEHCPLREYYIKGKSYREIAGLLGRNVSSVSRELRKDCTLQKGTNKNLNGYSKNSTPKEETCQG